jgi:cyanate lyase
MQWLKLIGIMLQAVTIVVTFLRERELIAAGEAKAILQALEISNDRIREARAARKRVANSEPDPDDPYNID